MMETAATLLAHTVVFARLEEREQTALRMWMSAAQSIHVGLECVSTIKGPIFATVVEQALKDKTVAKILTNASPSILVLVGEPA